LKKAWIVGGSDSCIFGREGCSPVEFERGSFPKAKALVEKQIAKTILATFIHPLAKSHSGLTASKSLGYQEKGKHPNFAFLTPESMDGGFLQQNPLQSDQKNKLYLFFLNVLGQGGS